MEQCTLKLQEVRMSERCRDGLVMILIGGSLIDRQFQYRLYLFFLVFYRVNLNQILQELWILRHNASLSNLVVLERSRRLHHLIPSQNSYGLLKEILLHLFVILFYDAPSSDSAAQLVLRWVYTDFDRFLEILWTTFIESQQRVIRMFLVHLHGKQLRLWQIELPRLCLGKLTFLRWHLWITRFPVCIFLLFNKQHLSLWLDHRALVERHQRLGGGRGRNGFWRLLEFGHTTQLPLHSRIILNRANHFIHLLGHRGMQSLLICFISQRWLDVLGNSAKRDLETGGYLRLLWAWTLILCFTDVQSFTPSSDQDLFDDRRILVSCLAYSVLRALRLVLSVKIILRQILWSALPFERCLCLFNQRPKLAVLIVRLLSARDMALKVVFISLSEWQSSEP